MSTDFKSADRKLRDIEAKFRDVDPDLRFMAFSDLHELLLDHSLIFNKVKAYSTTINQLLLDALKDVNTDVQNQALRCFKPLVSALEDDEVLFMISKLNASQTRTTSITTSIQTMAIAEVLKNINLKHASTGAEIVKELIPSLIGAQGKIDTLDAIETLTDCIKSLGTTIPSRELSAIYSALVKTIFLGENSVGKKSITALGLLAQYLSDDEFKDLLGLIDSQHNASHEKITLTLLSYISLAKSDVTRFAPYLDSLFQFAVHHLYLDDDELHDEQIKIDDVRFEALQLIDTLLSIGEDASKYIDSTIAVIKKFLVYDPYNNVMDEDDEDDYSEPDFSDDEYDQGDDESDDNSWKLRKQASKLATTLSFVFPNTLLKIYSSGIFESVLRRVSDSSDAVSFQNINTLDAVVKASSKHQAQRSHRKRRSSDDTLMSDTEDPASYLGKFRSSIVNKFIKEMSGTKGNTLNKYNEFLQFFQGFSTLDEELEPLLTCVREHNFGLNLELLKFYSAILRSNRLESFGKEFDYIVETVNSGLTSKNHISITNAIATTIDLSELTYNETLTSSLIEIAANSKNDSGIRNTAIEALAQVKCLPDHKVVDVLTLFAEALKYEPIVVSTVDSITLLADNYGALINTPVMESIITQFKSLLENTNYYGAVIDSLVSVTSVLPVSESIGDLLLPWFVKGSHQSQILRILGHMNYDRVKLTEIFLQASSSPEVEESALLDVSTTIGSGLIPILEKNCDNDKNVKILAAIVVHEDMRAYVAEREKELLAGNNASFNLKFLGYVGEQIELSISVEQLMTFFQADETKIYAAETIGKVISQDSEIYLRKFLDDIKADRNRYLLLIAMKQVLKKDKALPHDLYSEIWNTLITLSEGFTEIDENMTRVISHIIGLILAKNSDTNYFHAKASALLNSDSKVLVYTVVAAIKFILAYDDMISIDLIESLLVPAFDKIASSDLDVKTVSMVTLITALNNQFTALIGYLPRILPIVYGELSARKEFQEVIEIGPFKHRIDTALEVRKNAFELLYKLTLNHAVLKTIDFNEILTQVVSHGLNADIVTISSLIITKLLEFDEVVLSDDNKETLKTGIDKLLLQIKKKEEQNKDTKPDQETKNTLLSLRNTVFPIG